MNVSVIDMCFVNRALKVAKDKEVGAVVFFDNWLLLDVDLDSLNHHCYHYKALDELTKNTDICGSLCVNANIPRLNPTAKYFAQKVAHVGKPMFYLSDMFRERAEVIADQLGIPRDNVRARELVYNKNYQCIGLSKPTPNTYAERLRELGREFDFEAVMNVRRANDEWLTLEKMYSITHEELKSKIIKTLSHSEDKVMERAVAEYIKNIPRVSSLRKFMKTLKKKSFVENARRDTEKLQKKTDLEVPFENETTAVENMQKRTDLKVPFENAKYPTGLFIFEHLPALSIMFVILILLFL